MVLNFQHGNDDGVKARYSSKAVVNLWSSLSDDTHKSFLDLADEYGCSDIEKHQAEDEPFSRNVFRAHSHGSVSKEDLRETLQTKLRGVAEVFSVMSPDGAGMMAVAGAQPFRRTPLDALTFLLVQSPSPRSHERVCRALNLAALNADKHNYLFVSKADHNESPAYPRKIAQIIGTLRWIDSTNIFSRGVVHRELEPGAISPTRNLIQETLLDLKIEMGTRPDELLGFEPATWLIEDLPEEDIWGEEKFEAYVRVPLEYEGTSLTDQLGGNGVDVNTDAVPVESIQVLMTREVSRAFVREVKVGGVRWLWENAHDVDHWCGIVPRDTEPQRAVEEFVRETLRVRDPDVLAVFEGDDVDG